MSQIENTNSLALAATTEKLGLYGGLKFTTFKLTAQWQMIEFEGGETLEKRKLELAFIDRNGKIYPIDEVSRAELAEGLEKISKETAKRLLLVKEQR
jgi:hypothetical protein